MYTNGPIRCIWGPRPRCVRTLPARRRRAISAKIFVGNLSFQSTEQELTELFSQVGEVVSVNIPTHRDSGQPRGFAFVEFTTDAAASEAIEKFNGQELGGRKLRIDEARSRAPHGRGGPRSPGGHSHSPSGRDDYRGGGGKRPHKSKGSRRGLRRRKRSL